MSFNKYVCFFKAYIFTNKIEFRIFQRIIKDLLLQYNIIGSKGCGICFNPLI